MFRANARRTGCYDAPGVPDLTDPARQILITESAGEVFALAGDFACYGDCYDWSSFCGVDLSGPTVRWRWVLAMAGATIKGTPAITPDAVYALSESARQTELLALDARTGRLRWRRPVDASSRGQIAVADGTVYLTSEDGLLAVDAVTAAVRVLSPGPALEQGVAAGDGLVCAFGDDGWLRAFEHPSGAPRWAREFTGDWPILHRGTVYARARGRDDGDEHALYALDAATGETRWRAPGWGAWAVVFEDVVCSSDGGARVAAHDVATGALRWSVEIGGTLQDAAGARGVLYVAQREPERILALDVATGRTRWSHRSEYWQEIAVAGEAVYLPGDARPVDDVGLLDSDDQDRYEQTLVHAHEPPDPPADPELAKLLPVLAPALPSEAESATAAALAREAATALAPWGAAPCMRVEFRPAPGDDSEAARALDPFRVVHAALAAALPPGERGALSDALAAGKAHELGPRGDAANDLLGARLWARAVALGAVVPERVCPGLAGTKFSSLPDPFAPSLAVWRAGFALWGLEGDAAVVLAPDGAPETLVNRLSVVEGEALPERLRASLLRAGASAVAPLGRLLEKNPLTWPAMHAARLLLAIGTPEAAAQLVHAYATVPYDSALHDELMDRLPELGALVVDPAVAALAADPDRDHRFSLLALLHDLGVRDERYFAHLLAALPGEPGTLAEWVSDYGDPRAVPVLREVFEHCHETAKREDVEGLRYVLRRAIADLGGEAPPEP